VPSKAVSPSGSGSDLPPVQTQILLSASSWDRGSDERGLRGPAKKRALAKQPTLFDWALGAFSAEWEAVYGVAYIPAPKDKSQLGRMLAGLKNDGIEPADLPGLFRHYVNDPDKFLSEKLRHPLWHFCSGGGLNKYRARAKTAGYSEKEIRGAMVVAEFAGGGDKNGRG
jgi:hypothetical protein